MPGSFIDNWLLSTRNRILELENSPSFKTFIAVAFSGNPNWSDSQSNFNLENVEQPADLVRLCNFLFGVLNLFTAYDQEKFNLFDILDLLQNLYNELETPRGAVLDGSSSYIALNNNRAIEFDIVGTVEWMILAHASLSMYQHCLSMVFAEAQKLHDEESYWSSISTSKRQLIFYLISNSPFWCFETIQNIVKVPRKPNRLIRWLWRRIDPIYLAKSEQKRINLSLEQLRLCQDKLSFVLGTVVSQRYEWKDVGIEELKLFTVKTLDAILLALECDETVSDSRESIYNSMYKIIEKLNEISCSFNGTILSFRRPSFVRRWWIPIVGGLLILIHISTNEYKILVETLINNLVQASTNFTTTWIIDPLKNMWDTVRCSENRLTLIGDKSLEADLASLERMTLDYAKKVNIHQDNIKVLTRQGDLTFVYTDFENQLAHPIRNIIVGDLVRLLFIQIQKTKVDLSIAMTALDRLLRSNELNFAFLTVIPTWAVLVWGYQSIGSSRFRWFRKEKVELTNKLRLLELEIIKNMEDSSPLLYGKTLLKLNSIRLDVQNSTFLDSKTKAELMNDFFEIENYHYNWTQKLWLISRSFRLLK